MINLLFAATFVLLLHISGGDVVKHGPVLTSNAVRRLNSGNAGFHENEFRGDYGSRVAARARARPPTVKRYGTRPRPNGVSRRGSPSEENIGCRYGRGELNCSIVVIAEGNPNKDGKKVQSMVSKYKFNIIPIEAAI